MDGKLFNDKLLVYAGFKRGDWSGWFRTATGEYFKDLDDNSDDIAQTVPDFPHSIDKCFQYLVPKALERLRVIYSCDLAEAEKRLFGRWLGERDDDHQIGWTEALCRAIEKLVA